MDVAKRPKDESLFPTGNAGQNGLVLLRAIIAYKNGREFAGINAFFYYSLALYLVSKLGSLSVSLGGPCSMHAFISNLFQFPLYSVS